MDPKTPRLRLVAYLRVSSAGQIDAWGLDRQEEAVRVWARQNGARIVGWQRDEGFSGTLDYAQRPGLAAAVEMLGPKVDGILIADVDRLARELMIQEATLGVVWERGGRLFTATQGEVHRDDPDGVRTLIRQVLGAVVQFNKTQAVAKMRQGREAKARTGKKASGAYAFGYRGEGKGRDRDAAPDPIEQRAVRRIVELHRQGRSYRQIAAQLDAEGVKPKRAEQWSAMACQRVVKRHVKT